jgi:hypothetical protein
MAKTKLMDLRRMSRTRLLTVNAKRRCRILFPLIERSPISCILIFNHEGEWPLGGGSDQIGTMQSGSMLGENTQASKYSMTPSALSVVLWNTLTVVVGNRHKLNHHEKDACLSHLFLVSR